MMEMVRRMAGGAAAMAVLAACASGPRLPVPHIAMGEDFALAVAQTAVIAGEPLTVRFAGVADDSRCPVGVQCIRAGEAKVRIVMHAAAGEATEVVLATAPADAQSAAYGAYDVRLVSLAPQPRVGVTPAYVATLRVTRR